MSNSLFAHVKPIIGVIHVGALPGTPASTLSVAALATQAADEARLYRTGGVDGVVIENMHDVPYMRGAVGPEIVAAMAVIGRAVQDACALPVGVQILAGANIAAVAVAHAAMLDFIRVEAFAFAHVADEGWLEASAAELLRYRKLIGAEQIAVWADVKKKHAAHAVTADVSLGATAAAVEFMRADAVIVTGSTTGEPPQAADVLTAKEHCCLPVILGSGVDVNNIAGFYSTADGFIIGSHFKTDGHWAKPVDARRVGAFMEAVRKL